MTTLTIRPSVISAEPEFTKFWDAALAFQQSRQLPVWPAYPRELILEEIAAGRHFSAVLADETLAGYFSITLSDPFIWAGKEKGDAVYIHRICVNPDCRGNNLASAALVQANNFAVEKGRDRVRMDTWGDNQRLIDYYCACGFRYIGSQRLKASPNLAPHYHNANVAYFENEV